MIKFENYSVMGWEHAIRGMRNPKNSWERSDTGWVSDDEENENVGPVINYDFNYGDIKVIGPNDQSLMMRLRNAGTDHRKFMRMITVYVDITAPLYWWKEFDTYKVGTVANSCSTMHTIHEKEFTLTDFSVGSLFDEGGSGVRTIKSLTVMGTVIKALNEAREAYLETKDMRYWHQMIQLLPTSYNQKRTIMFNYEVLANMYKSRKNHKLDEWHALCRWIETLPYSELITGGTKDE